MLFDTVNRLGDPNFLLWLSDLREGPRPPASARLRDDLRRWLSELNPDDFADLETAPEHHWEHDGWAATFKPIAIRPDARGRPQSAIGVYGHLGASVIDDAPAIRNALAAKHHAYGDLGAPFVVAVGTYIFDLDRRDSANALYGRRRSELGQTSDGQRVTRMVRAARRLLRCSRQLAAQRRHRGASDQSAHALQRRQGRDHASAAP